MKNILCFIILSFTIFSCEVFENANAKPENIDLVTGLLLRADDGGPVDANGNANPNNRLGNPNVSTAKIEMYPNPAKDQLFVYPFEKRVKKVWIMKGDVSKKFKNTNFVNALRDYQYDPSEITSKSEREFSIDLSVPSPIFALRVADFARGYYRVFFQLENDSIRWDNLYIHKEDTFEEGLKKVKRDWD